MTQPLGPRVKARLLCVKKSVSPGQGVVSLERSSRQLHENVPFGIGIAHLVRSN